MTWGKQKRLAAAGLACGFQQHQTIGVCEGVMADGVHVEACLLLRHLCEPAQNSIKMTKAPYNNCAADVSSSHTTKAATDDLCHRRAWISLDGHQVFQPQFLSCGWAVCVGVGLCQALCDVRNLTGQPEGLHLLQHIARKRSLHWNRPLRMTSFVLSLPYQPHASSTGPVHTEHLHPELPRQRSTC